MKYAAVNTGEPVEISGPVYVTPDGDRPRVSYFQHWTSEELAAIGVHPIVEPPIPEGKVATGSTLEWNGETVTRVWQLEDYVVPVPASASPLQIRKALRQMELKASIDAYLATQDDETQESWEYAVQIERDNPLIAAAAAELEKTDAEIDDLFRLAATL